MTDREARIVDTMRRHRVDGLIVSLAKTTRNFEHFTQLEKYNIPVVYFDRVPDTPEAYSVSCNLQHCSGELVDWLVGQGHRKIGFIKGPDTMLPTKERLLGFQLGLKKHGIKPETAYVVSTDLSPAKTADAIHKLMALRNRPTAVIAFNDYVALDAMKYAKGLGLKINKDISFVSFANLPVTSYLDHPPAASIEQFPYQQAEKATEILLQLINKQEPLPSPRRVVMEGRMVVNKG
jgi:LacI family transcriptional regulator